MTKERIKQIIKEEITKADVKKMIDDEQSKFLKSKEFEAKVKTLSAKVIEELYKLLWMRKSFWADSISK